MRDRESQEFCKWPYAMVDGLRKHVCDAMSGERGVCPLCGSELVAKKGEVRLPHWAHLAGRLCDDWYQPKGPWHQYWQGMFQRNLQEIIIERDGVKHIADVQLPSKWVVEVQWSPISPEEIARREEFYGHML